ncbi:MULTISPECIES: methionine ABC transporter permease [Paraclostridium]|uniref:ABC transporter permease subunit n=1 Tax=Paraclostridium bifermentans TaxID=1490 RepID=A0AA44DI45_PARBF|nr:ABC transporter permease subunit [Paraclostridium bifermentans]MBN8047990.1 ABC transporter permease subunit [Paraclostridium bifermentans]MCR1876291.1 ABC transporter permease subunit [Paraclostridium bifermentans]NME08174.1 ABC transporter permease subunit [Paraclostridium bifermentans]
MFTNTRLFKYLPNIIIPSIIVTLKIMFFSAILSIIFGIFLGIVLVITDSDGLNPNKIINSIINKTIDIIRSFPVLILIVALMPLTRIIVGTTIGANAAIFTITVACTPFAARMTQNSLQTVDKQVIKMAKSFGLKNWQIILKVMIVEALPTLVSNLTILLINMLNVTSIAGAVGAGGLGAVALTYGYQRFDDAIMYFVVAILLIFVAIIQGIGNKLYKYLQ